MKISQTEQDKLVTLLNQAIDTNKRLLDIIGAAEVIPDEATASEQNADQSVTGQIATLKQKVEDLKEAGAPEEDIDEILKQIELLEGGKQ